MDNFSPQKRPPLSERVVSHLRDLQQRLQYDEPVQAKLLIPSKVTPDMLDWDMMLGEALKAIDIFQKYPDFYQTLLGNRILRENFASDLQMLIQLNQEPLFRSPGDEPLPDLSFLKDAERFRWKHVPPAGKTSIVSPAGYLQKAIFDPASIQQKVYRSAEIDDSFHLINGVYSVSERPLKVNLVGILDDEGVFIKPNLWLAADYAPVPEFESHYMVHLNWDGYDDVQTVELETAKEFLPIEIDTIMDPEGELITASLQLSILSLTD